MATTLIVRDATLVINGAPEKRGAPGEHLRRRLEEIGNMDPGIVEECAEVLTAAAGGEESPPDVIEAVILISLGTPQIAARMGLTPVQTGRRLASRLERMGQVERAMALLETLLEHHPGERSVERDLGAIMRRQGMVRDLAERYFSRAQSLIREGRTQEGIGWLKEILQLDRSRKDVARMIRDLRFQEQVVAKSRKIRWKVVVLSLLASLGLTYGVLRELYLLDRFRALSPAIEGNEASMKRRLADLESFVEAHPIWHQSLELLKERSYLRVEIDRIEGERHALRVQAEQALANRRLAADSARHAALELVDVEDFAGALASFEEALTLADEEWEHRAQVERDVVSIRAALDVAGAPEGAAQDLDEGADGPGQDG